MIGILILIGIASLFVNYAKEHNLNKWLWGVISIVSYFLAQVVAGVLIGIFTPEFLYDEIGIIIAGLLSGIAGVGIAFFIMKKQVKRVKASNFTDDSILDTIDETGDLNLDE